MALHRYVVMTTCNFAITPSHDESDYKEYLFP